MVQPGPDRLGGHHVLGRVELTRRHQPAQLPRRRKHDLINASSKSEHRCGQLQLRLQSERIKICRRRQDAAEELVLQRLRCLLRPLRRWTRSVVAPPPTDGATSDNACPFQRTSAEIR